MMNDRMTDRAEMTARQKMCRMCRMYRYGTVMTVWYLVEVTLKVLQNH